MQSMLNFSKTEVKKVREFLSSFEVLPKTSAFQEFRAKIGESTITLFSSGKATIQGKDHEKVKNLLLEALSEKSDAVIGIDETGRGELEGPFVITALLGNKNDLRELRDSKKSSKINEKFELASKNSLAQAIVSINPKLLDELRLKGMTLNEIEAKVIEHQILLLREFFPESKALIDGAEFKMKSKNTEFIVKGDDLEPVIGAASVVSKHYRNISGNKDKRKTWKNYKEE